jgi:hypothetical protein
VTEPTLPSVTIVIEWENAIDAEERWACRAMAALAQELAAVSPRMQRKPEVAYLYDPKLVDPNVIPRIIAKAAPTLGDVAEVSVTAAPGLSYYRLKNYGVAHADTDLSILLDSDAAPEPGWLEGMIIPFADPSVMAVGGITVLAHDDLLSRTLALSWIFGLAEERKATAGKRGIYANNTAVRTTFFRDNPFPDLRAFKKQCVFWLDHIGRQGHRYIRTADALTIHAPHPSYKFMLWRAWMTGLDRDFQGYHMRDLSRIGRLGYAVSVAAGKIVRGWSRIIRKRKTVDLPLWQVPAAMLISLTFALVAFTGQLGSALFRSHGALPAGYGKAAAGRIQRA